MSSHIANRYHVFASRPPAATKFPRAVAAAPEAAEAAQFAEAPPGPDVVFQGLCSASGIDSDAVRIQRVSSDKGTGLFAARDIAKGTTVLRVPRSMCIVIDNDTGAMTIPAADWPRLSGGLMQDNALTWDVLEGLALMDAVAGDGDPFYEVYADQMLPQPEELTLPMCWHTDLLQQLQHPAIIQAAQAQQERLRSLLPPEYMSPIEDGLPSYLQWGFACVRSRAFRLGAQAFGCVPFLDFANHADNPNADIRVVAAGTAAAGGGAEQQAQQQSGEEEGGGSSVSGEQGFVELVALADISAGSEVTMSYSGQQGYTNQRFMAQYGFVPGGGNVADRVGFEVPDNLKGVTFRLSHLENALGASLLMEAAQRKNPYLIAALKSLPLTADDVSSNDAAAMAAGSSDTGSSSSSSSDTGSNGGDTGGGRGIGAATAAEKQLAAALTQQLQEEMKDWSSSLAEDEQLLLSLVTRPPQLSPEAAAALGKLAGDPRLLSAVKYRVERKRLLQASTVLLSVFTQD